MTNLNELKKQYENIPIPDELQATVLETLRPKRKRYVRYLGLSAVAAASIFVGSFTMSPSLADSLTKVPLVSNIVNVFSVTDIQREDEHLEVAMNRAVIEDVAHKDFEDVLNKKYKEENKVLFDKMTPTIEEGGRFSLQRDVSVITDSPNVIAIQRMTTITQASAAQSIAIDNIDPINEWVITLPSLFKDERYIRVISDYIASQIQQAGPDAMYFTDQDGFTEINAHQTFAITDDGKLVIYFDEYEVAAGAAGIVKFIIPTEVLQPILASDYYIH
ncbi:RsiV family protein [Metalysinibacillus jejuensis]|uniref:RsiV family protein n=1 Tax=Metalysinibacillus jejuensis TaxID=914327 RepID=UPI00137B553C|nr:RsiV family protein [Metalysinibacillus jejuensis]